MGQGVLSPVVPFQRRDGLLEAGGVSLEALAETYGTPLYVYSADAAVDRVRRFQTAFQDIDFLLAYSVKANGSLALLNRMAAQGIGADIVSGGELARVLRAGIPASRIVFAGVGKTEDEMEAGLRAGILSFHVESEGELRALAGVAARLGIRAPIGLRVNPDILTDTPHAYTRTGHAATKFGIPVDEALALYRSAAADPWLKVVGIDVHIGSQILDVSPYLKALETVLGMVKTLRAEGIQLTLLDLGGGFGVGYDGGPGLAPERLAEAVVPVLRGSGLRLVLEPGRSIVGEAGVLLTRVLYVKQAGGKTFAITDAGMTELLRPSHYDGWHRIEPVRLAPGAPEDAVDVVGPVCETGDFLARDRTMPVPEPGTLLSVGTAGAYGFVMASNYNARPRPPEVMIEGGVAHLVRPRETGEDLMQSERIPPPLPSSPTSPS